METLIVSPSTEFDSLPLLRQLLNARPYFSPVETVTFEEVGYLTPPISPVAFVLMNDDCSEDALAAIRCLRNGGAKHVLAVGMPTDPKLILRSIRAGADVFLDESDLELELEVALGRLQLRQTTGDRPRQVIAVLGTAGGCGASTVAVNLAVLFARTHGQCNLIDLNIGQSDLGPLLDLKPQYTLDDLCRNDGRLDGSLYEKLLTRHECGVSLLAAPQDPDDTSVTARGVARAIGLARDAYREVVIDVKDCRHEEQWPALEQATRILLVTRLTFTAVRNARRILDRLAAHDIPKERVDLVINHAGLPNEVRPEDAAEAIGRPIRFLLPHDAEAVNGAVNIGEPLAIGTPTSPVVTGLAKAFGLGSMSDNKLERIRKVAAGVCDKVGARVRSFYRRLASWHQPQPAPPLVDRQPHTPTPEPVLVG